MDRTFDLKNGELEGRALACLTVLGVTDLWPCLQNKLEAIYVILDIVNSK